MTDRFELTINSNGQADIIDLVESKEKNAICIYNDLGVLPYSSAKAVCDKLNEQEETIQTQKDYIIRMGHGTIFEEMKRLKERNQRQYERLKEITDLMSKRDWKTLETMVKDWEQAEEQLEREWGTYGDIDD